jgi:hypothetical protein
MRVSPDWSGSRLLIFDTGPLWELILYSAVHVFGYRRLEPDIRFLKHASSYRKFTSFVASFHRRTTTSSVVAELEGHIRRTLKTGQPDLWGAVYNEFKPMRMEEDVMKFLEMPRPVVTQFGVVDASVLNLGVKTSGLKPKVLTIDQSLAQECKRAGLSAIDIWEVLAGKSD